MRRMRMRTAKKRERGRGRMLGSCWVSGGSSLEPVQKWGVQVELTNTVSGLFCESLTYAAFVPSTSFRLYHIPCARQI
jgi:hypothetical protein